MMEKTEATKSGPPLPEWPAVDRLLRMDLQQWTKGFLLVYAMGFLVVIAHNAEHGPLMPTILEGRYVLAGVWLALFSALPVVAGYILAHGWWRGLDWDAPRLPWKDRAIAFLIGTVLAGGGVLTGRFVLELTGVQDSDGKWLLTGLYVAIVALMVTVAFMSRWSGEDEREPVAMTGMRWLMLPAIIPPAFGLLVYPEISPRFGGGAGWEVSLVREGDLERSGLVVAAEGTVLTVLTCIEGPEREVRTELWSIDGAHDVILGEIATQRMMRARCR